MDNDYYSVANTSEDIRNRVYTSLDYMFSSDSICEVVSLANKVSELLVSKVVLDFNSIACLDALKFHDNYTFSHCVDVASISMMIAKEVGLPIESIREVGIAGLLHDIGKQAIPIKILGKGGKLTDREFDLMKEHPIFSYLYIRGTDLSEDIKLGVLEHHEKYCGGGYPLGLSGNEINQFARLLMIADVYSALVTKRCYRDALEISDCIEVMDKMSSQFDDFFYKKFLGILVAYPDNSVVRLSDGRYAIVLKQNKGFPLRPVVKFDDESVIDLVDGNYSDLSIIS